MRKTTCTNTGHPQATTGPVKEVRDTPKGQFTYLDLVCPSCGLSQGVRMVRPAGDGYLGRRPLVAEIRSPFEAVLCLTEARGAIGACVRHEGHEDFHQDANGYAWTDAFNATSDVPDLLRPLTWSYATVTVGTASGNHLTVVIRPSFVVVVHKDGHVSEGDTLRVLRSGRIQVLRDGKQVYRSTGVASTFVLEN